MSLVDKIFAAFIPLFFAFSAIGILPVYISMTQGVHVEKRREIVNQAGITALAISIGFMALGKFIFQFLGITMADFKVAGGVLLLLFSINDLLFQMRRGDTGSETMGVVPIGMPLIIGPGVLTTLLLSMGNNGNTATVIALVMNIAIVWFVFWFSDQVIALIGKAGAIAMGKIFALFMAAIGVMMIRVGLMELLPLFMQVK
jgi:multiple antibiotic resistance protein